MLVYPNTAQKQLYKRYTAACVMYHFKYFVGVRCIKITNVHVHHVCVCARACICACVYEKNLQKVRCFQETEASKVLGVLEHEEEVEMSD